jgi:hypothetical protein
MISPQYCKYIRQQAFRTVPPVQCSSSIPRLPRRLRKARRPPPPTQRHPPPSAAVRGPQKPRASLRSSQRRTRIEVARVAERLERYAEPGHGMLEIDNNWAENAMRGVALGRKNWIQIGSESAGPKVAALLSVLETCKRLRLNAREYLLEVLPALAYRETRPGLSGVKSPAELTPTALVRLRTAPVQ